MDTSHQVLKWLLSRLNCYKFRFLNMIDQIIMWDLLHIFSFNLEHETKSI